MGHADFRRFWFAALLSNTGSWMQSAAIPFVIFELTRSSADVGITGFWIYLPMMLMSAVGGSLSDRFSRRTLLYLTQAAQAAVALGLWAVVAPGNATALSISLLGFVGGLTSGLNIPVWQSFVSQLVPRELLPNAVSLNSTQFNAGRALGPLLAGVVIARISPQAAFLLNAASFAAVMLVLPFIHAEQPPRNIAAHRSIVADLVAGVRYVWNNPPIRACCVAIIAVAGLGNPLFSFLPATFGQEVFGVTGWKLGLLAGAGGIGAMIIAPVLLTRGSRAPRGVLLGVAMTGYGVGAFIVGAAPSYWSALAGALLWGGSYLVIAATMNTTVQLAAREEMRGKAIAVYIMCLTGALPLGTLAWGLIADQVGIRATTIGAAGVLLGLSGWLIVTGRLTAMDSTTA